MASTYTTELRIEKIETGQQSGTWGTTTNTQYDMIEAAISGTVAVAWASDADDTLTTANGADDEARHMFLNFTGGATLSATRNVVVPTSSKLYFVRNGTSGSQSIVVKTTSGTGITVPNGAYMVLYCDGTNVVDALTTLTSLKIGTSSVNITTILDEDAMGSDSAVALATQQSIKAYADTPPTTVTVADESADTTCFPLFVTGATGDLAPKTGSNITFNSSTGELGATILNATSIAAASLTGTITGADNTVSAINLKDYGEVTNAIGSIGGGTQDIDLNAGNSVTGTVDTSTTTFTFSNPTASDELCGFTLGLTNGASQTVNWPSSVDWAGGSAPTLTTSGVDWLVFWTVDGGTIWNGALVGAAFA